MLSVFGSSSCKIWNVTCAHRFYSTWINNVKKRNNLMAVMSELKPRTKRLLYQCIMPHQKEDSGGHKQVLRLSRVKIPLMISSGTSTITEAATNKVTAQTTTRVMNWTLQITNCMTCVSNLDMETHKIDNQTSDPHFSAPLWSYSHKMVLKFSNNSPDIYRSLIEIITLSVCSRMVEVTGSVVIKTWRWRVGDESGNCSAGAIQNF